MVLCFIFENFSSEKQNISIITSAKFDNSSFFHKKNVFCLKNHENNNIEHYKTKKIS